MSDSSPYINGFIEHCEKSGLSTTQAAVLYELSLEKRAQQGDINIGDLYTNEELGLTDPFAPKNKPEQKQERPDYGPRLTDAERRMTPRERAIYHMKQRGVTMPWYDNQPKRNKPSFNRTFYSGDEAGKGNPTSAGNVLDNAEVGEAYGVKIRRIRGTDGKMYRIPAGVESMTALPGPDPEATTPNTNTSAPSATQLPNNNPQAGFNAQPFPMATPGPKRQLTLPMTYGNPQSGMPNVQQFDRQYTLTPQLMPWQFSNSNQYTLNPNIRNKVMANQSPYNRWISFN